MKQMKHVTLFFNISFVSFVTFVTFVTLQFSIDMQFG